MSVRGTRYTRFELVSLLHLGSVAALRSMNNGGNIGDCNLKDSLIEKPASNWCVYMIRCGKGSLYTGITNDLQKRFDKHAKGLGAKYLRGRLPLELVFNVQVIDKSEALKIERKIKRLSRAEKERLITAGSFGV